MERQQRPFLHAHVVTLVKKKVDKVDDVKRRALINARDPKDSRNTLDDDMINPFLFPVAEIARCYDSASPIKNQLEYNRLHDFESILSCISDDLYHDAMASSKIRP
jgi:hypothetical protein